VIVTIKSRIKKLEAVSGDDEVALEELVRYSFVFHIARDLELERRIARSTSGKLIAAIIAAAPAVPTPAAVM
jgi:hypothetical protein